MDNTIKKNERKIKKGGYDKEEALTNKIKIKHLSEVIKKTSELYLKVNKETEEYLEKMWPKIDSIIDWSNSI